MLVNWIFFVVGNLLHVLKRADLAHGTKPLSKTPWTTVSQFVVYNWPALLIRIFISVCLFLVWIKNPDIVTDVARAAGQQFAEGSMWRAGLLKVVLPLNAATAGLFGFSIDSLLDWLTAKVPALQHEIPDVVKVDSASAGQ